jgi:hypothetical protein
MKDGIEHHGKLVRIVSDWIPIYDRNPVYRVEILGQYDHGAKASPWHEIANGPYDYLRSARAQARRLRAALQGGGK